MEKIKFLNFFKALTNIFNGIRKILSKSYLCQDKEKSTVADEEISAGKKETTVSDKHLQGLQLSVMGVLSENEVSPQFFSGMFCHENGIAYSEITKASDISSVVAYEEDGWVIAVYKARTMLPWARDYCLFRTQAMSSGYEASYLISRSNTTLPCYRRFFAFAAEWSFHAKLSERGDYGFLGSVSEMQRIFSCKDTVNTSLRKIGNELSGIYWTSTEIDEKTAWAVRMSDGKAIAMDKKSRLFVQPLILFKVS